MKENDRKRCGYAAVIGLPNVGKSTLLNRVLGSKLSIVTSKPQTTRNRVLAVHNHGEAQIVFLDTPGIHRPKGSLGAYMVEAAHEAIAEADVCAWLLDTAAKDRKEGLSEDEGMVARRLEEASLPTICLLNKVDRVKDKARLLPLMHEVSSKPFVRQTIPVSALDGDGIDTFLDILAAMLPEGPALFPDDMLSDMAERFFVAELVREAVTDLTRQEIPYTSAVVIDRFVEETNGCLVHATIHVERPSQKGIIIGKGGAMIREIGERARKAAEEMLACRVDLRLHVDVTPGWTKDAKGIRKMGYE